ncbi:MAG: RNA polymerase sigma factor [Patescibacteria group bacterium]
MDYSNLDDISIVEITIKNDKNAFAVLISRYQGKLFSYILRLINHREESADVLQEVFLKAYKSLKSFNSKKSFSSWIYRIAHNESVNWLKKNTKYKKQSLDDENNPIDVSDSHDLSAASIINEERVELIKSLAKLPIKYKEVLVLRFVEEKSYEEISQIISKSVNAVGIMINRAKKMLAEIHKID